MKKLSKEEWAKKRKKKKTLKRIYISIFVLFIVAVMVRGVLHNPFFIMQQYDSEDMNLDGVVLDNNVKIKEIFLTPNEYSRPQTELKEVTAIVVHYVGNPSTTAENNRDYFEGLKSKKSTYASSHFVIGLEGEIVQCVPLNEVAYASNERNNDTISIEVCHEDETGEFNKKTYKSLISLLNYLCDMFQLNSTDIIRHYDVTGKLCPLYYVEHQDAWVQLKDDVAKKQTELRKQAKAKNK